tara:strand:+ start:878 stop:1249 length:372 start_codon:yes stop_codon:yes gene_type:complete
MKHAHIFLLILFFNIDSQAEIMSIKCPFTNDGNKRWTVVLNTDHFNKSKIYAEYAQVENEEVVDFQIVELKITPRSINFDIGLQSSSKIRVNKIIQRESLMGITGSSNVTQCEMSELPNINKL